MIKEFGCIGRKLGHSFSKEIHNALADYEYELFELEPDELCGFFDDRKFRGINVTVPYKEAIIPYLDGIDEFASAIGAVNTVIKDSDGKLMGYNTDFYGLSELIKHAGVQIENKKVLILGTGGTSKTARAVSRHLGAKEILTVSRTPMNNEVSYTDIYARHCDADVIINTTPVGMYPNNEGAPIDIGKFKNLCGVIDAVYNPLRTRLISDAKMRGIAAEGGLYMLVGQAVRASEIFLGITYPCDTVEKIYNRILKKKESIVLIGMPASGKTTVGKLLSENLGRCFIDTDELIIQKAEMTIPEIFEKFGEAHFRKLEEDAIYEASMIPSAVIATGGGAILSDKNVYHLKQNGSLYFIDRSLDSLIPTSDRPTASDRDKIEALYKARYKKYESACDVRITDTDSALTVMNAIRRYYQ